MKESKIIKNLIIILAAAFIFLTCVGASSASVLAAGEKGKKDDVSFISYAEKEFLKGKETISTSGYKVTEDTLYDLVSYMLKRHPEYPMYISGRTYKKSEKYIEFIDNLEEDPLKRAEKTKKAAQKIKFQGSEYEKIKALHNYLIEKTKYATADDLCGTSGYDVLIKKKGICQGYAAAYKLLCDANGIKCKVVTDKVKDHAWNIVKIDGKWYNIDVCWDDENEDPYQYFLVSDENAHGRHAIPCDEDWQK